LTGLFATWTVFAVSDHTDRVSYLVSALGAHTKNRFTQMLVPLGVSPQHFAVLRWLADHDGATQQEIADLMQVRRNLMVGLVDDLEGAELLTRGRHPVDRRAHALHLTAAGRRTLAKANRAADQLDAELLAMLDPELRTPFHAALRQLGTGSGLSPAVFEESRRLVAGA
jgi:DNA-binding MarR family transcriptional regulator